MNEEVKKAIEVLKTGGIVIFPTDTAFGIGCRMDDEEAVKRLFRIRNRPQSQPTPVLFDSLDMMQEYLLSIPEEVIDKLANHYWPGALTIVLPCKTEKVPQLIRGNGDNLGVRIPKHQIMRSIIKAVGIGILGPSANLHGEKTPFEFKDLDQNLVKLADFVLEGECTLKETSTVIDCSRIPWEILREGAVKLSL